MHIILLTIIKQSISFCSSLLCSCIVFHELGSGYKNKEPDGDKNQKAHFPNFHRSALEVINSLRLDKFCWQN